MYKNPLKFTNEELARQIEYINRLIDLYNRFATINGDVDTYGYSLDGYKFTKMSSSRNVKTESMDIIMDLKGSIISEIHINKRLIEDKNKTDYELFLEHEMTYIYLEYFYKHCDKEAFEEFWHKHYHGYKVPS